jgi:GAF domain-containing protein
MRRRSKTGGEPVKTRRRKTASKPARRRASSVAGRDTKVALLTRERDEALARQAATAEILSSIRSSTTDTKPVFEAILRNLLSLFGTRFAIVVLVRDGMLELVGIKGEPGFEKLAERYPVPLNDATLPGRAILTGRTLQLAPVVGNRDAPPGTERWAREFGYNALISVPLIRDGKTIGALNTAHRDPIPFSDKQVALIESFADQAVIAIENTRLLNELRRRTEDLAESLEQQTATTQVLSVISSSPGELMLVFNVMLENAVRICDARFGVLFRFDDNGICYPVSTLNLPSVLDDYFKKRERRKPSPGSDLENLWKSKRAIHTTDMLETLNPSPPARLGGGRTQLAVPMLKDDRIIGAVAIYRTEIRPFTDKQIELVKNFAAQAAIAIENTRLLNELRQSLDQQRAMADVLRVISSSPSNLEPVFQALLENATRICEAKFGVLFRFDGEAFHFAADVGTPPEYNQFLRRRGPFQAPPGSRLDHLMRTKQLSHTGDDTLESFPTSATRLAGARTIVDVPMLNGDVLIGFIAIYRLEVRPFTDKQIALLQNFAAQAVIAIENTRLLNELRQRTGDLTESLEQQTATSDVLKIISSSLGELEPVFQAILENAVRICDAKFGMLFRYENESFDPVATLGVPLALTEYLRERRGSFQPVPGSLLDRVRQTKQVARTTDYAAEPAPGMVVKLGGARATIDVPMLKDGALIGAISIYSQELRPFTDKKVELVQNFAAQAVIAIENTRLLNELRQRTDDLSESLEQQTATSEVLKVISSSPGDLKPVFEAILQNATRICQANFGTMYFVEDDAFRIAAMHNAPPAFVEARRRHPLVQVLPDNPLARAAKTKRAVQIADVADDPNWLRDDPHFQVFATLTGARSLVTVPMLKDEKAIGVFTIYRLDVRPFTDKQTEILTNFAAQAVIAIENTRLLTELRQRTIDLTKSLEDLRTAQDRLVQTEKLASLGQLTAGIAHEIKNPLNFVNNFSSVSVELIDELRDALAGAPLDAKLRAEIADIADMLQSNLDKVVQHGKRADSIVKNMLLHSREGSGERRPVDINALVEESLNLAYHGARAERQGFNITMEKSLDPAAGAAELFPQDVTRVLLNLISNLRPSGRFRPGTATSRC